MTLQQVISCAPFRLAQPRNLTSFEWTVVEEAIARGYESVGVFARSAQASAQIRALVGAIAAQPQCPGWRTSAFGPAPAVAPLAYECFGAWFARLDAASQARALYDIGYAGLLCGRNLPAGYQLYSCPPAGSSYGIGRGDQWEGSPQNGTIYTGAAVETCAYVRDRIVYTPVTGKEMIELFKAAGGQVQPQMAAAAQMATFINRSFLLGIQLRQGSPALTTQAGSTTDLLALAKMAIEEAALIWAPGKGGSVMFLVDGSDPTKLLQLMAMMAPDLLNDVLPGLPNLLPGLIPPAGDPFWSTVLGTATQILGGGAMQGCGAFGQTDQDIKQPGTPVTGVDVVDTPGEQLDKTTPPIEGLKLAGMSVTSWLFAAGAAALVAALGWVTFRRRG